MDNEIQHRFDDALDEAIVVMPEVFVEKRRWLFGIAGISYAIGQVTAYSTDLHSGLEMAIGLGSWAIGTVADRVETVKVIRENEKIAQLGAESPYAETFPFIDTSSAKSFMKDPRGWGIDLLMGGISAFVPVGGFIYGSVKVAAAENNRRKANRLRLAQNIFNRKQQ